MSKTATPRATRALAALILVCGLAACERGTPATKPLREASIKLDALAPDGAAGPAVGRRSEIYNEVLTSLKPVADKGRNGETGRAYLLMAQSQAGLAEGPASQAAEQERLALHEIQAVRDSLSQWLTLSALAEAAAAYDPSKELAEIDAQIKEKQEQRLAEQQKKAAVDQTVAGILQQAKAKSDQAKAKRQESGALKAGLASQTATQAEQSLMKAQEVGRQADALEVEGATLEAQAAQKAPESVEIQLQIDKLTSQKELLERSKAGVQKRADSAKAQAAENRAKAAEAAATLAKSVKALETRREGDLATAEQSAIGGFGAALASAKKAITDSKGTSQMTSGAMQQALGDIHWGRARGSGAYADLMDTLVAAKPALPDAGQYKTKADKARADAKAALEQATESYAAANDAYRTGAGSQLREKVAAVNESLAMIVDKTSGGSKDIRDPDAPKPEAPAAPEGGAGSAAIEPGSPQETLQAFFNLDKSGDYEKAADLIAFANDQDKAAARSLLAMAPKFKKLDDLMKSKFGEGMGGMGGGAPGQGMGFGEMANLNAASIPVTIEGDTATATIPTEKEPLKLIKKDGKWLLDASAMKMGSQELAMAQMMVDPLSKALDEITADVQAGKFANAQDVGKALGEKMMGAMGMPNPPRKK